jgi:plasmid stabilization system protein ParE
VARKVVWTEPAADDLLATVEYVARDSPGFAAALAQRVCDAGDSLADLSERGRPYPDPAYPGLRELILGPYRLVYEVETERVVIHGVFHASRNVPRLVRSRISRRTRGSTGRKARR